MFWPIYLPLKIVFWVLAALLVTVTAVAPIWKWSRLKAFLTTALYAIIAFIPSCIGVMQIVDQFRFGEFEYATFADIEDFRARRYLPTGAADIKMHKLASGYRAWYTIPTSEFNAYLDNLWDQYGEFSQVQRGGWDDEGTTASAADFKRTFGDLGWPPMTDAIIIYSPTEPNGAGATYYVDKTSGVVMQRTGYW